MMLLPIETEREADGRWIAEIAVLPGVQAYGATESEARSRATALAFRVIADRIEHGEAVPDEVRNLFALARDEIGPRMLARIAKRTGLEPEDL